MDTNNSKTPKELEGEALNNSLRDDSEALDSNTIGQDKPTPPPILKGAEEFNFENGTYKINISSSVLRADYLMNLCLGFLEEFKKKKSNKNGEGYIN